MGTQAVATRRATTGVGTAMVFASYVVVATLFCWPMPLLDPSRVVTRQFDLFPTLWLLERAGAILPSLHHAQSGYPFGEDLARVDSYVLIVIAWVLRPVFSGGQVAALVGWLGPAISATFAERCAVRAFHVPRPWSWVAGCAFAFSGIASTALLEGHVHHLLNPWLPLLVEAMWRLRDGSTRYLVGWRVGVWWALGLFTSGYFGILGAIVILVGAVGGRVTRPLVGALVIAIPAGLTYVLLFQTGGRVADHPIEEVAVWTAGANTLSSMLSGTPSLDLFGHSIGAPAGFTLLWLLLFAPLALRGEKGWVQIWLVAVGALLLTFGARLQVHPQSPWAIWWPGALIAKLPGVEWFRFPVRFAWLYALFGGIVAARTLRALSAPLPRFLVVGTWLLIVGDAFLGTGMPFRLTTQAGDTPSAYDAAPAGRAVLDLWALPSDRSQTEVELRARALSCYYQAHHERPILELCIGTQVDSPREVAGWWFTQALFVDAPVVDTVRSRAEGLGLGAIAVHADLYRPADLAWLLKGLTDAFGAPAADTTDGGERVVLFAIPAGQADPAATYELLRKQVLNSKAKITGPA